MRIFYIIGTFSIGALVVCLEMINRNALDNKVGTPSKLLAAQFLGQLVDGVDRFNPSMGRIDGMGCNGTSNKEIECQFFGENKFKVVLQSPKPVPEFVMFGKRSGNGQIDLIFTMGLPALLGETEIEQFNQTFSRPKLLKE